MILRLLIVNALYIGLPIPILLNMDMPTTDLGITVFLIVLGAYGLGGWLVIHEIIGRIDGSH